MDVKKFKIPKGVATDINRTNRKDDSNKTTKTGTIEIYFSKYKVN